MLILSQRNAVVRRNGRFGRLAVADRIRLKMTEEKNAMQTATKILKVLEVFFKMNDMRIFIMFKINNTDFLKKKYKFFVNINIMVNIITI